MVWEGIALGTILEKVKPRKKLIRNLHGHDGSDKKHHFANFSQHGLAMNCLWVHFEKREENRTPLSGICGFVTVLARLTIFPTWSGKVIDMGNILEKAKPREKPYEEYVGL